MQYRTFAADRVRLRATLRALASAFVCAILFAGCAIGDGTEPPRLRRQLSEFVRRIHQDRAGNLWFGTNGDGVFRHDGETLTRFGVSKGFGTDEGHGDPAVRAIVEDASGILWFGTSCGMTRYDGSTFRNYTADDGLQSPDVWSLCIDRGGILWVGTYGGACRFDPATERFTSFWLPPAEAADPLRGVSSTTIIHAILADSRGDVWFAQSTAGVYRYDGSKLTHYTEKDGLTNGSVNDILEDRHGNFWFATHHGGICRFDGTTFVDIMKSSGVESSAGLEHNEAWDLFEDSEGNLWFPIKRVGVYRYDGERATKFDESDGLASNAVQCTFEDHAGRIWFGGYRGLSRLDGKHIVLVKRDGPW
ncbi:MAG: hypothetical protein KDC95_22940 [Planctomycetes bacterium]|nr:hypothetical protein [Planctomycetota bacterium]